MNYESNKCVHLRFGRKAVEILEGHQVWIV